MIKEYHLEIPYRELAATKYVEWLGIKGVNYTTIQKAIARLLEDLLDEAARALAELVSSGDMDCVGWRDETGYGKRFPEEQEMAALVNRFKDEIRTNQGM